MKTKLSLLIFSTLLAFSASAQKASKGAVIAEGHAQIGLFWFYGPSITPAMRFRYFITDQYVVNAAVRFSNNVQKTELYEFPDGTGEKGSYEWSNISNGFIIGGEKHFGVQEKFSPFVGLNVGYDRSKQEQNTVNADNRYRFVKDYWSKSTYSATSVSIEGLVGADFWINRNFYLGTDMGLNYTRTSAGEREMIVTTGGVTTVSKIPITSGFTFGDRLQTTLRLGFRFN